MIVYTQLHAMQLEIQGAQLDVWIDFNAREIGFLLAETLDAKLSRIKRHAENAFVDLWIEDQQKELTTHAERV